MAIDHHSFNSIEERPERSPMAKPSNNYCLAWRIQVAMLKKRRKRIYYV